MVGVLVCAFATPLCKTDSSVKSHTFRLMLPSGTPQVQEFELSVEDSIWMLSFVM